MKAVTGNLTGTFVCVDLFPNKAEPHLHCVSLVNISDDASNARNVGL